MFLCEKKCHDPKCESIGCQLGMGMSYGKCEGCGQTALCFDCHDYKKPKKKRKKKGK
jgi:hypothetical protein